MKILTDKIIKTEVMLCPCCMETHEVQTVEYMDKTVYNGVELGTDTISCYCSLADTYFEVDEIISRNYRVLVETYQKLMENKNEAGN